MGAKYLLEIFQRFGWPPHLALTANIAQPEKNIINFFQLHNKENEAEYWTDWGGTYDDLPTSPVLQLFFGGYLSEIFNLEDLADSPNSFILVAPFIYFNLPFFSWQYGKNAAELSSSKDVAGYSTAPRSAEAQRASDDRHFLPDGNLGRYPARLKVPSPSSSRLPDSLNDAIVLQKTFSAVLENHDGVFDKFEDNNFFNAPMILKKTLAKEPLFEDFAVIRRGLVETLDVSQEEAVFSAADPARQLDEEVCRTFTELDYPDAPEDLWGKNMPLGWGSLKKIELFAVDSGGKNFVALDPLYQEDVTAVYDGDGTEIVDFTVTPQGVINVPGGGAQSADVEGRSANKIGEIITRELQDKSLILYQEGPWDKTETDLYIADSPRVNNYIKGGSSKELLTEIMRSDQVVMIQKNDGRLTLRVWGGTYASHVIPPEILTRFPEKTHTPQKFFQTSAGVRWSKNEGENKHERVTIDTSQEDALGAKFRKKKREFYETNLTSEADAKELAEGSLSRYGGRPELWRIGVGIDTSGINLLDSVSINLNVNGRELTPQTEFVVIEIDPGQDVLLLQGET